MIGIVSTSETKKRLRMTCSSWALLHWHGWSDLSWASCAGCVRSLLGYGGGPCSDGKRLSAGEATVLDQLPQLRLRQPRLVVGNRHRLRDVAGLDGANWRKLAQSLLNFTTASSKVEPFDWHRHRFHAFPLSCAPASFAARRNCTPL